MAVNVVSCDRLAATSRDVAVNVAPGTSVYRRALAEWVDGRVGLCVVSILAPVLGVAATASVPEFFDLPAP